MKLHAPRARTLGALILVWVGLSITADPVGAQDAGLSGWIASTERGALYARSPAADDGGEIVIVAALPDPDEGAEMEAWFERQLRSLGTQIAKDSRSGIVREGTLYKDGFDLRSSVGAPQRAYAFGYATRQGRQFVLLQFPAGLDEADPRLAAALDLIADRWKSSLPIIAPDASVAADLPGDKPVQSKPANP